MSEIPFGLSEALGDALRTASTSSLVVFCTNLAACRKVIDGICSLVPCTLTNHTKDCVVAGFQIRAGLTLDRRLPIPNNNTLPDRSVVSPSLSPCPACKKLPEVIARLTTDGVPYYLIQCATCPAGTGKMRMTIPEAVTLWERHYGAQAPSREGL